MWSVDGARRFFSGSLKDFNVAMGKEASIGMVANVATRDSS